MKSLIIFLTVSLLVNSNPDNKKVHVVELSTAMFYPRGLVVLNTDSIFYFNKDKYVVKAHGFYNENEEINHCIIWTEMGYEDWPNKDMAKFKDFLYTYGFTNNIEAGYIDDHLIKVNSDTGLIKEDNKAQKVIYYILKKDQNPYGIRYLHKLIYQ